jgi:hypothetical protein
MAQRAGLPTNQGAISAALALMASLIRKKTAGLAFYHLF